MGKFLGDNGRSTIVALTIHANIVGNTAQKYANKLNAKVEAMRPKGVGLEVTLLGAPAFLGPATKGEREAWDGKTGVSNRLYGHVCVCVCVDTSCGVGHGDNGRHLHSNCFVHSVVHVADMATDAGPIGHSGRVSGWVVCSHVSGVHVSQGVYSCGALVGRCMLTVHFTYSRSLLDTHIHVHVVMVVSSHL